MLCQQETYLQVIPAAGREQHSASGLPCFGASYCKTRGIKLCTSNIPSTIRIASRLRSLLNLFKFFPRPIKMYHNRQKV